MKNYPAFILILLALSFGWCEAQDYDYPRYGFYSERFPKSSALSYTDAPRVDAEYEDLDRIVAYLEKGEYLFRTFSKISCLFPDDDADLSVQEIDTDGSFVWTKEFVHYVKAHKFAVPEPLLTLIRTREYQFPELTDEEIDKVLDAYYDGR